MRIGYFDCFSGVSGDMFLGALVDAGVDADALTSDLSKLNLQDYEISFEKVTRNGISGTRAIVHTEPQTKSRHLDEIESIILASNLDNSIIQKSIAVFRSLAEAEAKIHNTTPDKIHFHEVGGVDAIVDIVGAMIGLKLLGLEKITSSSVSVGSGFVECAHGTIPVPAPATLELLKGIPIRPSGIEFELATPTGAAIIKNIASEFEDMPSMKVTSIGYGAGSRELPIPNMLRLVVGESVQQTLSDRVELIEANIDDMIPEQYEYLMEELFAVGALDVWLTPIIMKKTRPATMVSLLVEQIKKSEAIGVLFKESTTIGVRSRTVQRQKLPRKQETVQTIYGEVKVKLVLIDGLRWKATPEYDDCKRVARESGAALRDVYEQAVLTAKAQLNLSTG